MQPPFSTIRSVISLFSRVRASPAALDAAKSVMAHLRMDSGMYYRKKRRLRKRPLPQRDSDGEEKKVDETDLGTAARWVIQVRPDLDPMLFEEVRHVVATEIRKSYGKVQFLLHSVVSLLVIITCVIVMMAASPAIVQTIALCLLAVLVGYWLH